MMVHPAQAHASKMGFSPVELSIASAIKEFKLENLLR